jgi:hypothetical protein
MMDETYDVLHVRVSTDEYEAIRLQATQQLRPITNMARVLLVEALAARAKAHNSEVNVQ